MVARSRPFELLSPGFVAVREELGTSSGLTRSGYSPPAPFTTVEVSVGDAPGSVLAGLSAENGDHLVGFHDAGSGQVGLELRTGETTTILAHSRVRRRVHRLAFVLCENQPTVLVDTGCGWRPVVTDRHRVAPRLDLRVPSTLARFTATWGLRGGTPDGGLVRAGLFGMAGIRDLHVVQHADGTPYTRDGRMFLTATCSGLGFFQQAHWGVFAFDPADLGGSGPDGDGAGVIRLEQTAHLFSRRDGLLLGDHAGQMVRDGDRWLVGVSSWGDFAPHRSVHVRHATTTDDLLDGVHLLDTEPAPMPTTRGSYDPGMTRINGRWHVSYVESVSHQPSEFHPALAVGKAGAGHWTEGLQRVGEASDLSFCEGPILARPDGEWRVLASDGRARRYRVFDLAMRPLGDLDAPYGTNLPHPQIFELPDGQRFLVTFDGTQYGKRVLGYGTHGDVIVMRASRPPS
ncbi:MAG: hypothetical protein ACRDOW_08685 [Nocardioidaceae bacterium]